MKASKEKPSWAVIAALSAHAVLVLALVVNAVAPQVQGPGLFATALTVALAIMLWTFVRRIASLFGKEPGDDWDPKRG